LFNVKLDALHYVLTKVFSCRSRRNG